MGSRVRPFFSISAATLATASPAYPNLSASHGPARSVKVEDFEKSMIAGHEVKGKRFALRRFPPRAMPEPPQLKEPLQVSPAEWWCLRLNFLPPTLAQLPLIPSVTEVWASVN